MYRGILLIIQVVGPREKRTNLFAQNCPEVSPAGDLQADISLAGIISLTLPFGLLRFIEFRFMKFRFQDLPLLPRSYLYFFGISLYTLS